MKKLKVNLSDFSDSFVRQAAKALERGSIVAFPTETVYGLGCWADNKDSVDRLYAIKKRPKDKPFSIALASVEKVVNDYFADMPPFGYRLMEEFWPGPLTIVYRSKNDKKIGIRVPSNVIAQSILQDFNRAVYLPSANISGQKEAISADEVENIFNGNIDLIIDGGECKDIKSSTVVDLTQKPFKILREGIISYRDILSVFTKKRIIFVCTGNSCRSPMAQLLLEKYLSSERPDFKKKFQILSAGISTVGGFEPAEEVIEILKREENIDATNFRSRMLTERFVLSSDIIITMEDRQKEYIIDFVPSSEGRVFNLKKFLPSVLEQDIPDPIGMTSIFYNNVYTLLRKSILELKDWLQFIN